MLPKNGDLGSVYKLYIDAYMSACKHHLISEEDIEAIRVLTGKILDIIGGSNE